MPPLSLANRGNHQARSRTARELASAVKSDRLFALELLSGDPVSVLPAQMEERRERMERHLGTEFMLATGLWEEPRERTPFYVGQAAVAACGNPFALLAWREPLCR